jgi:hypothetical protein
MPDTQYRLFFDNKPATPKQLDRVENITVEQEIDMATEARLEFPIWVDERGKWKGEDEKFMKSFSRIRVEIMVGKSPFVPLIDGPVVGAESQMSFEPGQSSITLIVQDDSVYLNREEKVYRFEKKLDHEIAQQIYSQNKFKKFARTEIDKTLSPGGTPPLPVIQRGTEMKLLRFLAKRQGMHAYVLPGDRPGESIGAFKEFPQQADVSDLLPPLIVLGAERNVQGFDVKKNAQSASDVRASTIRLSDKKVVTRTARFRNLEVLGESAALEAGVEPAVQILPPGQGESIDLQSAVSAKAKEWAYAFEATGSTLEESYLGVLRPYRLVPIRMGDTPLSGIYQITKVTHSLTGSTYSQSFALRRNAQSPRFSENKNVLDMVGSIF